MFSLLETATAFAVVMLAVSLFVSALVALLVNFGRYRSRTVVDMLRALIHGFRVFHNDPDVVDPATGRERSGLTNQPCEMNFVTYVLTDPALQARRDTLANPTDPEKLTDLVEYIDKDDLVALVFNAAKSVPQSGQRREAQKASPVNAADDPVTAEEVAGSEALLLPDSWVDRKGNAPKGYATTSNFAAYVERWFDTVEGTACQSFKKKARRLTLLVSLTVVVLFNLDGLRLISDLYQSGAVRQNLTAEAPALETTATRLSVPGALPSSGSMNDRPDANTQDLLLELSKTSTILDDSGLKIGWQKSWITERYCAYRGLCSPALPPPSIWQLVRDTLFWFTGLTFSCIMLSLGAPFWVTVLSRFINVKNEVQKSKEDGGGGGSKVEAKGPPSSQPTWSPTLAPRRAEPQQKPAAQGEVPGATGSG